MPKKYDPEVKDRAVRMVLDHRGDYGSQTKATIAVGSQLGIPRETLRRCVSQARVYTGDKAGGARRRTRRSKPSSGEQAPARGERDPQGGSGFLAV
ncbi:hypothetical protein [Georgenia sp. AZ-5]|uniref:hypothetical protein n=1 Tax=Georgenia sp. AZ-5 TaxID=3367526 RepID=UPI0037542005